MKKTIFFTIIVLISIGISAQVAGTFDSTFNTTGIYVEPANIVGDNVYLKIKADGKLVVAGSTNMGAQIEFFVMQFNPDGTKDTDFATNGALVSVFGSDDMIVKDMVVHENGKIAIAGHFSPADRGFIVRINSDGSIDTGFGIDGLAVIDLWLKDLYGENSEYVSGIEIHSDENDNWGYILSGHYKMALSKVASFIVRYKASGMGFDFGFLRSEEVYYGSDSYNSGVKVLADNTILTAGWFDLLANSTRYFYVSKKLVAGADDTSFGFDKSFDGFSSFNFNNGYSLFFHGFSLLSNNKLLFVGEYQKSGETSTDYDVFVLQTTEDGDLDWAYGGENHSYKHFEFSPAGADKAYSIQEIQDGKTLISGAGSNQDAAILCLDSLGEVVTEFGNAGELVFDVQGDLDIILSSALNVDKSTLFVAGRTYNTVSSKTDLFLAAIHTTTAEIGLSAEPAANFSQLPNEIKIWPNPVQKSGTVHLDFQPGNMEIKLVELFSANGQLIGRYPFIANTTTIKIPDNLNSGLYMLKFSGEELSVTKKLIVQ